VILRRDFLINASYRLAFLFDTFFGVMNLLIYYFISQTLTTPETADLGGAPNYFAFVAVGATITLVVQAASITLSRKVREEQLTGTLELLTTQPVNPSEIALGFASYPFLFATLRASLYLLIAQALLGIDLSHASWLGFVVLLVVTGTALSTIGISMGALTLVLKRADALAPVIGLLLGLGGGAFFPISVLPGWLQPLGNALPTRWIFDGIRQALFVGHGWGAEAISLSVFTVVSMPIALLFFAWALRRARKNGSLSQY
jgi:ABC-type multidrug transport system permease subunit